MKVVLINPYELGRQPFGLAEPAAWLLQDGCTVRCVDLTLQKLDPNVLAGANLVAIYVGMHTATRIAIEAIPRIQMLAPDAHLCVYGLYAPMNEELLRDLGVSTVLGGEFEPGLLSLVQRLRANDGQIQTEPLINLSKIRFVTPDRSALPALSSYAHLQLLEGGKKTVGFAEGSRGCKHLCRHCPIVPVYEGKFRVVPLDVVMADIRNQVSAGAEHISFGDPDFLNGPTHAMKLVRALHEEYPDISYDVTIKVQHILNHAGLLPVLKDTGCLFITSAAESVDDNVLRYLHKNHTRADFDRAAALLREAGIALAPTFVPFTPWTTLQSYVDLLQCLVEWEMIKSVPPVQLAIRLLIPQGSYLLRLPGFEVLIQDYDTKLLGYPWRHSDPRVDSLQEAVQSCVAKAGEEDTDRRETFIKIWEMAHIALDRPAPSLPRGKLGKSIPHLSEPWYCCAEPTQQQLRNF